MSSNNNNTTKIKKHTIKTNTDKERTLYTTNTGHKLTVKQHYFIDKYVELGNARQAGLEAGYSEKHIDQNINSLLNKLYIQEEIKFRIDKRQKESIATGQQVMEFFTKVMKGEVKDQFGLEAPLSERLKAANELARRTVDIENKINGKADNKGTVTLNLNRGDKNE